MNGMRDRALTGEDGSPPHRENRENGQNTGNLIVYFVYNGLVLQNNNCYLGPSLDGNSVFCPPPEWN